MTKIEAQQQMILLLGDTVAGQLSPTEQDWCVEQSNGGGDYCPWLAAAEAAELIGGRLKAGQLTQFTADGATFKKDTDWFGWAAQLRSKSPRNTDFAFEIV